jgi:hypothetical protein
MIIADFKREKAAEAARTKILRSRAVKQAIASGSATPPDVFSIALDSLFHQEQVYLGQFPRSFFESGATYARSVERVCRTAGGITSFEERAAEWDEIFRPDGMPSRVGE